MRPDSLHKITTCLVGFTAVYDSPSISSLQNPTVRHLVRLRDNRQRQRAREIVVDGIRETHRALDAGLMLKGLFLVDRQSPEVDELAKRVPASVVTISLPVLQKIAFGQHHRDVVAWFDEPSKPLASLKLSPMPIVIVLDAIEKPGNIGAVLRSADAIGADAVILCQAACDLFNPSVIRASLGTVFSVPTAQADRTSTIAWLREHGITPVTARVDAQSVYWDVDYRQPVAIVIGSEANGLGEHWERDVTGNPIETIGVRIPMHGAADSLNASVSAALLMFEAARQRRDIRS